MELLKVQPIRMKKLGLDERWLQDRVDEDPTLLGLGDLHVIRRERRQPSGGRIDFLMSDPEEDIRYEIEIMLGTLDESHIIRTIEYWDIERRRFPALDHRAVIVAEDITNRFFNVINLLNQAVPIIALQLSAFQVEDSVVLLFTKVLDITEAGDDEEEDAEQVDRNYWEKRSNPKSLAVSDAVMKLVPAEGKPLRVTYNRSHLAIASVGRNFIWLHPRRNAVHCRVTLRIKFDERDSAIQRLDEVGVSARPIRGRRVDNISFRVTEKDLEDAAGVLSELFKEAESLSRP